MRVHASYWKREKYPAPMAAPLSRFILSLQIHGPHAEPAPHAGHVQYCRGEEVRRRATGEALQVGEGVRADERTDVAEHVHGARDAAGVLAGDVGAKDPAWADRHIRSECRHGECQ